MRREYKRSGVGDMAETDQKILKLMEKRDRKYHCQACDYSSSVPTPGTTWSYISRVYPTLASSVIKSSGLVLSMKKTFKSV